MRVKAIWVLCALALVAVALAAAGCGGGGSTTTVTVGSTDTTSAETTSTEETTTEDETTTESETTTEETTTEAETTTEEGETTEETDTTGTGTTALGDLSFLNSENCEQFREFASAAGAAMSGNESDPKAAAEKMQEFADQAPEEIRDDWKTLADYYAKLADAMDGVDTNSAADVVAAMAKISRDVDMAKVGAASQHFTTWLLQNCTGSGG